MAVIDVVCISCGSTSVYRHGKAPSGEQRYRCKDCGHSFQVHYRYKADDSLYKRRVSDECDGAFKHLQDLIMPLRVSELRR